MTLLHTPNKGKDIQRKTSFGVFSRFPYKTHLLHIKEDITPFLQDIRDNHFKEGDFIVLSEKFITISEGRLIHKSLLRPRLLAMLIYWAIRINLGEKNYRNDPGFAIPEKIQAAIYLAGFWRMFFAFVIGIPFTFLLKIFGIKKGLFYIIAGHRISEIDGPYAKAMPPFDEFAKIYPENPTRTSQDIEDTFGIPSVIIDGNNINTEVLGKSRGVSYSDKEIRDILLDNPMGQGSELTPIILVRKES